MRQDAYPFESGYKELTRILNDAQKTLVAQVEAALHSGDLSKIQAKQARLAAVTATLDQLGANVIPLVRSMIMEAYTQGSDRALTDMAKFEVTPPQIPGAFSGVSTEAVQALQAATEGRLTAAQKTVGRQINDIYAKEQRRAALRAILGAEGSPQSASKELQTNLLRDKLIRKSVEESKTGFVDSAGRNWKLDTYSNMAVRTATREAVVQGAMARMASHGVDLFRITTHAGSCEICLPFEGKLMSILGEITEYKGEEVLSADEVPPFHPNCRHGIIPVEAKMESLIEELVGQAAEE